MPVWLSPLFSALSQPVLSFFHLCQTNKSPALFVDCSYGFWFRDGFSFWIQILWVLCGFCFDFFFFFWGFVHGGGGRVFQWWWGGLLPWVWGGLLPWVWAGFLGCCRGSLGMRWWGLPWWLGWLPWGGLLWTIHTPQSIYTHTASDLCYILILLLSHVSISFTYTYMHACMLPFLLTWTRSTHTNTIAYTVWPC